MVKNNTNLKTKKMINLKQQLEFEKKTAIQWISLYKCSSVVDTEFWSGYLRAINNLIEIKNKYYKD
tara:strand:- start:89 stop:286 length:198 start_codon:yes stop_codon:yes gene_type:complete